MNDEECRVKMGLLKDMIKSGSPISEIINRETELANYCYSMPEDVFEEFHGIVLEQKNAYKKTPQQHFFNEYLYHINYRIGFLPKQIECCLDIIGDEYSSNGWKRAAYMAIGNMMASFGLYDEAYEYLQKSMEYNQGIQVAEECGAYSNLALVAKYLGKDNIVSENIDRFDAVRKENKDNVELERLRDSLEIDFASHYLYTHEIDKSYVEEYKRAFSKYLSNDTKEVRVFHDIGDDEKVFKKLSEAGFYEECADICKLLIENKGFFTGDFLFVYEMLSDLMKVDESLFTEEEKVNYRQQYFEYLEEYYIINKKTLAQVTREELRIHKIDEEYSQLRSKMQKDELTKADNRAAFNSEIKGFYRNNPNGCLIFMDVDGLKIANDTYGHEAGDELLKTFVGIFMNEIVFEKEQLFRYAGDEFILLTKRNEESTNLLIENVEKRMKEGFNFNNNRIPIHFSYGLSQCKEADNYINDEEAINSIIKLADKRMYECKRNHKKTREELIK